LSQRQPLICLGTENKARLFKIKLRAHMKRTTNDFSIDSNRNGPKE